MNQKDYKEIAQAIWRRPWHSVDEKDIRYYLVLELASYFEKEDNCKCLEPFAKDLITCESCGRTGNQEERLRNSNKFHKQQFLKDCGVK